MPKFMVQISNYGRFEIEAESRHQAEQMAEVKRRWERANNKLVWSSDLQDPFDRITEEVADAFYKGRGVTPELLKRRAAAREEMEANLIDPHPTSASKEPL